MRTSQSRTVPTLVAALVSTAAALKLATSTPQSITGVTPADVTIPSDDLGGAAAAGHWPLAGSDAREALEKCYSSPSACKEPAANNIDKVAPKSVKAKAAKETKTADGKISIGDEAEAAAIKSLAKLLPSILKRAGCAPKTSIWGVELAADKLGQRSSILAAFLRAREWRVDEAEAFLIETLTWRRENGVGVDYGSGAAANQTGVKGEEAEAPFPDDLMRTVDGRGSDGQPRTFIVLSLGKITREQLSRVDDFVAWRVRMQERACEHLGANRIGSHWGTAPRGPTYTLVLDTGGMRPFHFGSDSREALSQLTHVFTHYYPDFIGGTVVVNAPRFVTMTWSAVSRFMPTWWGVRLGTMAELEAQPGWQP